MPGGNHMDEIRQQYMDQLEQINKRIDELEAQHREKPNDDQILHRLLLLRQDRDNICFSIQEMDKGVNGWLLRLLKII